MSACVPCRRKQRGVQQGKDDKSKRSGPSKVVLPSGCEVSLDPPLDSHYFVGDVRKNVARQLDMDSDRLDLVWGTQVLCDMQVLDNLQGSPDDDVLTVIVHPEACRLEVSFSISSLLHQCDKKYFLMRALPDAAETIQCQIIRYRSSRSQFASKQHYVMESDGVPLIRGEKLRKSKTSYFQISTADTGDVLGKLRSNFIGTEFSMYDSGLNPQDLDDGSNKCLVRQELGAVMYETNIMGAKGPRRIKVLIPRYGTIHRPLRPEVDSILARHKAGDDGMFQCYSNKSPKWNESIGAFVIDFGGRVTVASVKNFQLCPLADHDVVTLQCGKIGRDTFTLDFRHPFSPFQAFALALSAFDNKLACE
eukprot:gnl/MRDRNA2_/MRDRNA2_32913_c0_seq1.p1 gnl/MRDRNA2_/MRDRNA2_32913_c0~~gnl/MRDRNA2_/MRDRNA2_32913_c0_seq1.p1  ORF type:complete len:363 (+),score=54.58 gnl/MRDRNA2_/MRDRNA2_32913_c0_seq1:40-1128(+)